MEIDIDDEVLWFGLRSLSEEFALRTRHKAGAPELNAARLSAGIGLMPYSIDGNDRKTVGYGMTALDELPGIALTGLFLRRITALIADGRGIDEDVGTSECHQTCALGIPLIPTDLHAKLTNAGRDGVETEIARREIELLIIGRVIGDVHLTMNACDAAVTLEYNSGIVIEAWSTTLEETGDENNVMLTCQGTKEIGGRTWDGLCKVEVIDGFDLAEVGCIVEFLQYDELGTMSDNVSDGGSDAGFVLFDVRRTGLLDEGCFHKTIDILDGETAESKLSGRNRGREGNGVIAEREEDGIMGDNEGGPIVLVTSTEEREGYALRTLFIEGRRGLVQKQEGLRQGEGSCDEEPLTLTARKLRGSEGEQRFIEGEHTHQLRESLHRGERAIVLKLIGETKEVAASVGRRLELLWDVCGLTTDGIDVVNIKRKAANNSLLGLDINETKEGT